MIRLSRPLLLDLYCCEGGASVGYERIGFSTIGVDIEDQPNYAGGMFIQHDALKVFEVVSRKRVEAIHASPPCQKHSPLGKQQNKEYPDLIAPTREMLRSTGLPYVIENVPGAPLEDPGVLCGSMFKLGATCRDGKWRQLRRHRLFETNWDFVAPSECKHEGQPLGVYGTGGGGQMTRGYKAHKDEALAAMEMPWASRKGVSQAIPPAYSEWVGLATPGASVTDTKPDLLFFREWDPEWTPTFRPTWEMAMWLANYEAAMYGCRMAVFRRRGTGWPKPWGVIKLA